MSPGQHQLGKGPKQGADADPGNNKTITPHPGPARQPKRQGGGGSGTDQCHFSGRQRRHQPHDRRHGKSRGSVINAEDRKSTRLNSSHVKNSYAVFCLKKKRLEEVEYYVLMICKEAVAACNENGGG